MKNTGIVRRIDELGRIVIPKEIRKTLRIKENENIEIYIEDDNKIVLKKHSLIKNINDFAQKFVESMHVFVKHNIIITDTSDVIAMAGNNKKEYLNKPISKRLEQAITRRESMLEKFNKMYSIIEDKEENGTYAISTIISNGDSLGLIIIFSDEDEVTKVDQKIANIASEFFGKYLDE